jgi:hypothetical protein
MNRNITSEYQLYFSGDQQAGGGQIFFNSFMSIFVRGDDQDCVVSSQQILLNISDIVALSRFYFDGDLQVVLLSDDVNAAGRAGCFQRNLISSFAEPLGVPVLPVVMDQTAVFRGDIFNAQDFFCLFCQGQQYFPGLPQVNGLAAEPASIQELLFESISLADTETQSLVSYFNAILGIVLDI